MVRGSVDEGCPCRSPGAKVPFRVLQIADDLAIADMYALGLEMHGFEVFRVQGGVAGLTAAASHPPDVVVIDIELSLPDGPAIVALLREDARTGALPAILLTSYAPIDYREEAASLGVDEVLLKSETTPRILGEAIHRHLGQPRGSNVEMSRWESVAQ